MGWSRRLDGSRPLKVGYLARQYPKNGFFEEIKTSFPRIYNKMRIWKVRGRGLPGRQNTPTPRGSIFKLSIIDHRGTAIESIIMAYCGSIIDYCCSIIDYCSSMIEY